MCWNCGNYYKQLQTCDYINIVFSVQVSPINCMCLLSCACVCLSSCILVVEAAVITVVVVVVVAAVTNVDIFMCLYELHPLVIR